MTFATDLESAAGDEVIQGIVIGAFGWGEISDEPGEAYAEEGRSVPLGMRGCVLPWEQARPLLDYSYSTGFGAPQCHAVTAWTATKAIFVGTYDGSTYVASVPRHPEAHEPYMVGGG